MTLIPFLILAVLLLLAVASFSLIYRRHLAGTNAVERQLAVQILDKQSITLSDVQPGQASEAYWVFVQPLKGGPKREFQVGPHYFHALTPGDQGTLTYRGQQFLHFALKR
ncbi:DUF2500 domain-containing protein [Photobacterium sp. 1_MG-2023]|uniref:DUF2500 domain-containing protein n=1 Tax=Photobacterium sp. 1_MG-2023 TaxID=3062646 RepID=UPI0026E1B870|nr:DUF2500 domain-containing protein [Photobacterium sp. 1_MG-2023]MDO6708513.1 DUF2500 domain-containing protein [Photobacterium sp. 1_MG-2023]